MSRVADKHAAELAAALGEELASLLPSTYEPLLRKFAVEKDIREDGRSIAIGDDYGTTLMYDVSDGHIRALDTSGKLPTRFMNSGVKQLAASIGAFECVRVEATSGPSDSSRLRKLMREIDPDAISDPRHWWAMILEPLECEQL